MADRSFLDHLRELFEPLGGVTFRRMFGGVGIFRDGVMFGLVADDELYLKVDETGEAAFEAEGCGRFVYTARGRRMEMSYRRLPERLYDEPEEFRDWALAACAVADRPRKPKKKKSGKRA